MLEDYFTAFEILATAAQLKEEDKVINATCYAPSSEKDFWSSIPEYEARPANYEAYKKAIYMWYPGSSAKEKWSFWDLENLCRERSRIEIFNAAQFANFDRDFRKIATALKKAGLIEELKMRRWYYNGLDPIFRLRVDWRLEAKNLDRDPALLLTMDELFNDATFILKGTSTTSEHANTEMRESSASYKGHPLYGSTAPPAPQIKAEEFDMDTWGEKMMLTMSRVVEMTLATALSRMQGQVPRPSYIPSTIAVPIAPLGSTIPASFPNAYIGPGQDSRTRPRPGDTGMRCFMCHDPGHFLGDCDVVVRYLASGKIGRNGNNLVMANGDQLPNDPRTASWAERIDEYYARHPAVVQPLAPGERDIPPHMSANFIEVENESDDTADVNVYLEALTEMADKAEDPEAIERVIRVLQLRTKEAKKVRPRKDAKLPKIPTIEVTKPLVEEDAETEDERRLPKVLGSKKTPYVDIPPKPTASKPSCPKRPQTTQPAAPQFKYSLPLEVGVSCNNVVQKILSQQVSLTVAEAIALSPEVRKFFKEGTTTRRIPTTDAPAQANMVSSFYLALDDEEELFEGAHSLPLRTLQVSLNEEITATAIIDSGCQIIIMRIDIWEKLGLPLLPDHIMVLESANGKSNATKGMLPRVMFCIGEIRLPCPV
jgi:hypothetical protein